MTDYASRQKPAPTLRDPEYIGDGVYVGHDGYNIWLYASHKERWVWCHEYPTDKIALEPSVYDALVEYQARQKLRSEV